MRWWWTQTLTAPVIRTIERDLHILYYLTHKYSITFVTKCTLNHCKHTSDDAVSAHYVMWEALSKMVTEKLFRHKTR